MRPIEYYTRLVDSLLSHPSVALVDPHFREIDEIQCQIKVRVWLNSGLLIHISEYLVVSERAQLLKYRYHVQRPDGTMVARWDNAAHHPGVSTHPHHVHTPGGGVERSFVRSTSDLFEALEQFLP